MIGVWDREWHGTVICRGGGACMVVAQHSIAMGEGPPFAHTVNECNTGCDCHLQIKVFQDEYQGAYSSGSADACCGTVKLIGIDMPINVVNTGMISSLLFMMAWAFWATA